MPENALRTVSDLCLFFPENVFSICCFNSNVPDIWHIMWGSADFMKLVMLLSEVGWLRVDLPFKYEARTALFKDPVRTAQ